MGFCSAKTMHVYTTQMEWAEFRLHKVVCASVVAQLCSQYTHERVKQWPLCVCFHMNSYFIKLFVPVLCAVSILMRE